MLSSTSTKAPNLYFAICTHAFDATSSFPLKRAMTYSSDLCFANCLLVFGATSLTLQARHLPLLLTRLFHLCAPSLLTRLARLTFSQSQNLPPVIKGKPTACPTAICTTVFGVSTKSSNLYFATSSLVFGASSSPPLERDIYLTSNPPFCRFEGSLLACYVLLNLPPRPEPYNSHQMQTDALPVVRTTPSTSCLTRLYHLCAPSLLTRFVRLDLSHTPSASHQSLKRNQTTRP